MGRHRQVTVNGDPGADMGALAAYVEQSDALLGVLTVRETIRFAAGLRLVFPSIPMWIRGLIC
jgi:ABC-type multidrug transport system ATPase subunit